MSSYNNLRNLAALSGLHPIAPVVPKRDVFISSFHDGNGQEVDDFIYRWAHVEGVFTPKAIGTFHNDDFINSDNPEYVMSEIRRKYLGNASVTIVLIGSCTHSRRYVDWEIIVEARHQHTQRSARLCDAVGNAPNLRLPR